ncbi:MAG: DUF4089 domain-containing protein [Lacisediminimonas sp.]|nr:DUF4089 domain-containing protein [Lacisediminimonas sp.]
MSETTMEHYVRAALALQGYAFDEQHIAEIALQFSRIAAIAEAALSVPLPPDAEPAPVYRP